MKRSNIPSSTTFAEIWDKYVEEKRAADKRDALVDSIIDGAIRHVEKNGVDPKMSALWKEMVKKKKAQSEEGEGQTQVITT